MTTSEQIIQSGGNLYLVEWSESEDGQILILRAVSEHGESIDCRDHPKMKVTLLRKLKSTLAGR